MTHAPAILVLVLGSAAASMANDRASDVVKGLPACSYAPPATLPGAWETKPTGAAFSVALPSCFKESGGERRFVHGGATWQCGTTTVEVVWGMWGAGSFGGKGTRCTATVAGQRVLVVQDRRDDGPALLVWYLTGQAHEPIVSVWSSRMEDAGMVSAIAFSGRTGHK